MLTRSLITLVLVCSSATAFAQADVGKVYLSNGQIITGRFVELTRDQVVVSQNQGPRSYTLNEVRFIQLPGEPREMMDIRQASKRGAHEQVIEDLGKIAPADLKTEALRQEVDFYRALALSKLAESGSGDAREAGKALLDYLSANANGHHFYDANEATGDLLVSMGRFDQAPRYYSALASAPWPDAKVRAAVAIGRSLQAQGKHQEAIAQFDEATKIDADGKAAESMVLAAQIGKAKSNLELGNVDEGIQSLRKLVQTAPAEDVASHALAYNALGEAYQKQGKVKEALYAYLHTDVLYNQAADQHAEALYHLKDLWREVNREERAKEAAEMLSTRYASSRWNKQ